METFKDLKIILQRIGVLQIDSNIETMILAKITNCLTFCILSVNIASLIFFLFAFIFDMVFSFLLEKTGICRLPTFSLNLMQKLIRVSLIRFELSDILPRYFANIIGIKDADLAYRIEQMTKILRSIVHVLSFCYGPLDIAFSILKDISSGYSNESLEPVYRAW